MIGQDQRFADIYGPVYLLRLLGKDISGAGFVYLANFRVMETLRSYDDTSANACAARRRRHICRYVRIEAAAGIGQKTRGRCDGGATKACARYHAVRFWLLFEWSWIVETDLLPRVL